MLKIFYSDFLSSTALSSTLFPKPRRERAYNVTYSVNGGTPIPVEPYDTRQTSVSSFIEPFHTLHARGYSEFDSGSRFAYTYLDQLGELQ